MPLRTHTWFVQFEVGKLILAGPLASEIELRGEASRFHCRERLDPREPIRIQALVQGALIECFVDDAHIISCRAYEHRSGSSDLIVRCCGVG